MPNGHDRGARMWHMTRAPSGSRSNAPSLAHSLSRVSTYPIGKPWRRRSGGTRQRLFFPMIRAFDPHRRVFEG